MDYRDRILSFVKQKPTSPTSVAKHIGKDSIIAAAMLSEMVSKKILKISYMKIGSSPLYFVPGTENMLESFQGSLDPKEQEAFALLKSKNVLRDSEQAPIVRLCLKNIKDFAHPLTVSFDGQSEIFYKWFLLSDAEARDYIRSLLSPIAPPVQQASAPPVTQPAPTTPAPAAPKASRTRSEAVVQAPAPKTKRTTTKKSSTKPSTPRVPPVRATPSQTQVQQELSKISRMEDGPPPVDDAFLADILDYCHAQSIAVRHYSIKRKNSEITLELGIPSSVGRISFHCLAKSKKKVQESDLHQAFVGGQLEKLPSLLLTKGELSKKALELLKSLKGVTVTNF
jgi:hypothetical protein